MRKYGLKIFIAFYVILTIGVILFCLNFRSTINSTANEVETDTQVLRQRLDSSESGESFEESVETEDILSRVRDNWTRTPKISDEPLPDHVLMSPADDN